MLRRFSDENVLPTLKCITSWNDSHKCEKSIHKIVTKLQHSTLNSSAEGIGICWEKIRTIWNARKRHDYFKVLEYRISKIMSTPKKSVPG